MATNPNPRGALEFANQVEWLYTALTYSALPDSAASHEPTLGGKLLYAGSLDAQTRALLAAANIAGAASLAVSADSEASKQASRDGVVDFLVNSLDEALRILKNEIRKRETVAVCVATAPHAAEEAAEKLKTEGGGGFNPRIKPAKSVRALAPEVCSPQVPLEISSFSAAAEADFAREMLERGVRPDLTGPIEAIPPGAGQLLMAWSVASESAKWLPRIDALALHCLDSDLSPAGAVARRWLRLAPRYLGRMARDVRVLRCDEQTAVRFQQEVREQVERGEIGVTVDLWQSRRGQTEWGNFASPTC